VEAFSKADLSELQSIESLYQKCKKALLDAGIYQWGDWEGGYPDINYLKEQIIHENLFRFTGQEGLLGTVVLNREQAAIWEPIPWQKEREKAIVIHALIINPEIQGKGYGRKLLSHCEAYATEMGCTSIRLDAFTQNERSNQLYLRNGYIVRGSVFFEGKPENCREYYCYEKSLS